MLFLRRICIHLLMTTGDTWRAAQALTLAYVKRLNNETSFTGAFQPCLDALHGHMDSALKRIGRMGHLLGSRGQPKSHLLNKAPHQFGPAYKIPTRSWMFYRHLNWLLQLGLTYSLGRGHIACKDFGPQLRRVEYGLATISAHQLRQ